LIRIAIVIVSTRPERLGKTVAASNDRRIRLDLEVTISFVGPCRLGRAQDNCLITESEKSRHGALHWTQVLQEFYWRADGPDSGFIMIRVVRPAPGPATGTTCGQSAFGTILDRFTHGSRE
jgi:hypothetical protein